MAIGVTGPAQRGRQQNNQAGENQAGDNQAGGGSSAPGVEHPSPPGGGALINPLFSGDHVLETVAKGGGLLRQGARGPAVRAIQQFLIGQGMDLGRWGADGSWGKQTTTAVKAYQAANGLGADGIIGKNTLSAMDAMGGGASSGPAATVTPTEPATSGPTAAVPTTSGPTTEPASSDAQNQNSDPAVDSSPGGTDANADLQPAEITIPSSVTNLNMREFGSALDPVLGGAVLVPNSAKRPQVYGVQRALSALGYDTNGIDGSYGSGTTSAVERLQKDKNLLEPGQKAGTTYARTLAFLDLNAPMHAQVLAKTKINYDKLFQDKLAEFGLFVGYDEGIGGHWHQDVAYARKELKALGFKIDPAGAAKAYEEAGRNMPDGPGEMWVNDTYTTHLGKNIKGVFRLVHSDMGDNIGEEFKESMMQGEVTMYSGHGRYGSGPDFDRNYSITVEGQKMSYDECKHYVVQKTGKAHPAEAEKAAMLKKLAAQGVIKVTGSNKNNVVMNDQDVQGTFGSALMFLALQNGQDGTSSLKRTTADYKDKATDNYKVWMFDGCSTKNYMGSIRRDVGKQDVAVMGTGTSITMCTSMEMVRGMMSQLSGAQIAKNMDKSHADRDAGGAHGGGQHFIDG